MDWDALEDWTDVDLKYAPPEAIVTALEQGKLNHLLTGAPNPSSGGADQGARGTIPDRPTEGMTAAQIVQALEDGSLDEYLRSA